MKRLMVGLLAGSLLLVSLPSMAVAGDGAIVDQRPSEATGCYVYAFQHGISGVGTLSTLHALEVWTPSGNINLVCQGELPEGVSVDPGYKVEGFTCSLGTPYSAQTNDSTFRANKAGNWTLTCKFSDVVYP